MKFCDKLPKVRKNNNLSQEQLADRLGVSRQAVSKWEQGLSYPDMDKILKMCDIFDCTLEDLLDDGKINKETNNKINISEYFKDFLKFITKVSNMFSSMKFTSKIKCLLENIVIITIIYILGAGLYFLLSDLIISLFLQLPIVGTVINIILDKLVLMVIIILGILVFIHLFKIRYLDYFVTIEDDYVKEKTIEEEVDKPKKKIYENKKEKIIIRDQKHSVLSFFNFLLKIILFLIKAFSIIILISLVFSFIIIIIFMSLIICHIKYGIIFTYIVISILGVLLINYLLIELCYKFIVNMKVFKRKYFILSIISFFLIGIGLGLSINELLSYQKITDISNEDNVKEIEKIKMEDNLILDFYNYSNVKYIINDNYLDITIEIRHLKEVSYELETYHDSDYEILQLYNYISNYKEIYDLLIDKIKDKKYYDLEDSNYFDIVIITSKENYDKLINNYYNYYNHVIY